MPERGDPKDTAHHAWHSLAQFPETCEACKRHAAMTDDELRELFGKLAVDYMHEQRTNRQSS